jgi:hypothetical protein
MSAVSSAKLRRGSHQPSLPERSPVTQREFLALDIPARDIAPGDHLPPQPALHGTRYQRDGFVVGSADSDILVGSAVLPGRMLVFGPSGTLDSVAPDTQVVVRRPEPTKS